MYEICVNAQGSSQVVKIPVKDLVEVATLLPIITQKLSEVTRVRVTVLADNNLVVLHDQAFGIIS